MAAILEPSIRYFKLVRTSFNVQVKLHRKDVIRGWGLSLPQGKYQVGRKLSDLDLNQGWI